MELSQRIAVYYLTFCLVGAIGLAVGVFFAAQTFFKARSESRCLAMIAQSSPKVVIAQIQGESQKLSALLEQIHRDQQLLYASVVSPDGIHVYHSNAKQVGKRAREVAGQRKRWDDVEAVRFQDTDQVSVCEYRSRLLAGTQDFGTLRLAVHEPTIWGMFFTSSEYLLLAIIAPAIVLGSGVFVLRRMTQPIAAIDSQLKDLAKSSSVDEQRLHKVPHRTPAAAGWNHLIDKLRNRTEANGADEKLRHAVLQHGQGRVQTILNSLPDGFAITDHEQRIRLANNAFASLLKNGSNVSPQALLGQKIESIFQTNDQLPGNLDATLDKPSTGAGGVRHIQMHDRVLRIARHRVYSSEGGDPGQQIWSVRDITQQKLADKMRDEFLDTATHELRTPLSNIRAYAETLVLSDVLDIDQQKEFCNTINNEATRLARFIDDLLSISSVEAGSLAISRANVEVDRMMRDTITKAQPGMKKKNIEFIVNLPQKELPELFIDKDKIQVALVNLLGNACKYTPPGGRVAVTVSHANDQIIFAVEDTGYGISQEDQARLFNKFFRSSDERVQNEPGSGLGLSLAQEIVRLHGGQISVRSQLGQGSTFTMTLPIVRGGSA
jgi:two-component system phosphate regulon sensor histidine kinase PhoR